MRHRQRLIREAKDGRPLAGEKNQGGKAPRGPLDAGGIDRPINPPISPSGEFIGDYEGMAANDCFAYPFWQDTTLANLPSSDPAFSPYQQVFSAQIANIAAFGGAPVPGVECPRPGKVRCLGKRATVIGTGGADALVGGRGRDVIAARGGNDKLKGKGGRDLICAGGGKDGAKGGGGNDKIKGEAGKDRVNGSGAKDRLKGGAGKDRMSGGARADSLTGGGGRDTLRGGKGGDALRGGKGPDRLRGGKGIDTCRGGGGKDHAHGCEKGGG